MRALALVPAGEGAAPADRLTLPYDARWRRRGRLVTEGGEAILLDLPRAEELSETLALALEDGRRVALAPAPEPVAEVSAAPAALARLAWHVGNRHTPAEILEGRLRILRDHVLEDMLIRLGAEIRHLEAPFRPEGGAYGMGRTHGHSHSHDPHHDPDAHMRDAPDQAPDPAPDADHPETAP
ncbi:urease accessory protein [Albimonas donghaensis]|uniref:Urease accessory protein UreE n=1 Tax=Albimonas donghaensis TaxID=356660 RepID=A0A1H2SA64_9RHOB|nr:urease accessory protein UreE [Albimonas donghaensis]SDW28445.1 urease accessory protein [Albimonas donghaensis]